MIKMSLNIFGDFEGFLRDHDAYKYTSQCSCCGGISRLRRDLLGTIAGSNGFYIKDTSRDKYFYNIVENVQEVGTKFWVKVRGSGFEK